jgi:hypothetical protein
MIHMAITSNGFLDCKLFPAQRQECKTIEDLWQSWPWEKIKFLVADKGYDSGAVRSFTKSKGVAPVIPPGGIYKTEGSAMAPENCYDVEIYQKPHIIERLFGRLK